MSAYKPRKRIEITVFLLESGGFKDGYFVRDASYEILAENKGEKDGDLEPTKVAPLLEAAKYAIRNIHKVTGCFPVVGDELFIDERPPLLIYKRGFGTELAGNAEAGYNVWHRELEIIYVVMITPQPSLDISELT
jgi:hypothetical protein